MDAWDELGVNNLQKMGEWLLELNIFEFKKEEATIWKH